jgi:hypothetical protein
MQPKTILQIGSDIFASLQHLIRGERCGIK